MKTLKILALLLFGFPALLNGQTFQVLNANSIVSQGGVVIVKLADDMQEEDVWVYVFGESYPFNKNGVAFIGVRVDQKPDIYPLYLIKIDELTSQTQTVFPTALFVEVVRKDFGAPWYAGRIKQRTPAVQKQRLEEIKIMHETYNQANTHEDYTVGPFIRPLPVNEVTDSFGTLRLYGRYNRKTKKVKIENRVPHGGVDLRAKTPTLVMAINSGKVLLVHYFPLPGTEGNLLIIDHGSGVLSLYLHLSKSEVKEGDMVSRGQVIAFTGATPKGTPPHLHLILKVNGVNVDPFAFIDTVNQYLK